MILNPIQDLFRFRSSMRHFVEFPEKTHHTLNMAKIQNISLRTWHTDCRKNFPLSPHRSWTIKLRSVMYDNLCTNSISWQLFHSTYGIRHNFLLSESHELCSWEMNTRLLQIVRDPWTLLVRNEHAAVCKYTRALGRLKIVINEILRETGSIMLGSYGLTDSGF